MSATGVATRTRSRINCSTPAISKPVKHVRSTRRHPLPPIAAPIPAELRGKRKLSGDDAPSKRRRSNTRSSRDGDSSSSSHSGQRSGSANRSFTSSEGCSLIAPTTPAKSSTSSGPQERIPEPKLTHSQSTPFVTAPSTPAINIAKGRPSTPPPAHPSAVPSTPAAQISQPHPSLPTPARDILRLNPDELKSAVSTILPRPPTPPKTTERSARNGYPAWATPKTTVKRPPSAFVTRQAMTAARPGIRAPMPVQPVPFDLQLIPQFQPRPDRQVVPLPNRAQPRPQPPTTPARQQPQPFATPGAKKITVPVPFGGSVSRNTQAAVNRVQATPSKAAASKPLLVPPKTPGPVPTKLDAPMSQIKESEEMEVDAVPARLANDAAMTVDEPMAGLSIAPQPSLSETAGERPSLRVGSGPLAAPSEAIAVPPTTPAPVPVAPPASTRTLRKRAPTVSKSLPVRRPNSRPASAAAVTGPPALPSGPKASAAGASTSSGPRYPSSLGSGPLNRPTTRVVSNNYRSISAPTPSSAKVDEPSARSLSYPAGRDLNKDKENAAQSQKARPRESLSLSSRRADTSICISSLDDTLARLKARHKPDFKAAPKRILTSASVSEEKSEKAKPLGSSARLSLAPLRPGQERHSAPSRFQVLVDNAQQTSTLKGVIAFVDVHSADGTDGSLPFIDMLKLSGARVLKRPSESCTHIIYKDGKPSTAAFWRRLPECKRAQVHVVGIKWLTMCRERGKWVDEAAYRVNLNEQEIFQVKRKSMEPKRLERPILAKLAAARPPVPPKVAQPYAAKVSSPLKQTTLA